MLPLLLLGAGGWQPPRVEFKAKDPEPSPPRPLSGIEIMAAQVDEDRRAFAKAHGRDLDPARTPEPARPSPPILETRQMRRAANRDHAKLTAKIAARNARRP